MEALQRANPRYLPDECRSQPRSESRLVPNHDLRNLPPRCGLSKAATLAEQRIRICLMNCESTQSGPSRGISVAKRAKSNPECRLPPLLGAPNRQEFFLAVRANRIPIHVGERLEGCRHGVAPRPHG